MKGKPWKDPRETPRSARSCAIVREVLVKLSDERSDNATIVKDTELTLTLATAFVKEKNLAFGLFLARRRTTGGRGQKPTPPSHVLR